MKNIATEEGDVVRINRFLRTAAIGAVIALLAGVFAGCGGVQEDAEINLGANLELTGGSTAFGTSAQRGAELAVSEINEQGGLLGKPVQLVVMDNKSKADEAEKVMKYLAVRHVSAVVGPDITECAMAVTKLSREYKIPVISPAGSNPKITVDPTNHEVYKYMFRATFVDPVQGRAIAGFARDRLRARTAAVLYDRNNEYSAGLAEFFKAAFTADGGEVVMMVPYDSEEENFRPVLTELMQKSPDVFYVPDYYPKALTIIEQARAGGITAPILGADGWDSNGMDAIAGARRLSGLYYTAHYAMDTPDPGSERFVKAFEAKYKIKPDNYAALGYDSVMMIADAIRRGNSAKPDDIGYELTKTINYTGVTGKITLDTNHDAVKDVFILSYEQGQQLFVEKVGA